MDTDSGSCIKPEQADVQEGVPSTQRMASEASVGRADPCGVSILGSPWVGEPEQADVQEEVPSTQRLALEA